MKIKAINDHVVIIEDVEEEKTTKAGVIIPTAVVQQPHKVGTVVSVGEKVTSIKEGDKVVYAKHGGQVMSLEHDKIIKVLKLGEIYCVLEDEVCDCSTCDSCPKEK